MLRNKKTLLTLLSLYCSHLVAMNMLQPYDPFVMPPLPTEKGKFHVVTFVETGVSSAQGYDEDGHKVDVLRIWNNDQNALKMLDGFPVTSLVGQKRLQVNVHDDGVRGHFLVCSDLDLQAAFGLAAHYAFTKSVLFGLYLPVYSYKLKNVTWNEQTKDITFEDQQVKQNLTNDFFNNVFELDECLELCGWNRTGVGDLTAMLRIVTDHPQLKPTLKNVRLQGKVGFSFPTGLKEDENKIFAFPYGGNGAFGLVFGGGLELTIHNFFKGGFDVELSHYFDHTKKSRIKTAKDQTELLLLKKLDVHKDYGFNQQFTLFGEFYNFFKGFTFKLGYQYKKHDDDTITFDNHEFATDTANTAESLKDVTMHSFLVRAAYDFEPHMDYDSRVKPYIGIFARLPFNGKRSAQVKTVGVALGVDF